MCHDKSVALGLSVRVSHRVAEAEISLRHHAKRRAGLVVLQQFPSSFIIDSPPLFNVSHLPQLKEESSEVHRTAAMLGLEICVANGIMLTKR